MLFYFGQPLALAIVALVSTLLESLKPKSPPALPPSRMSEKDIVKACLAEIDTVKEDCARWEHRMKCLNMRGGSSHMNP